MTRLQKLQVEQSELRSKIGAALDTAEDKRGETWQTDLDKLTKRAQTMELELRAALVSEETGEEKTEETTEEKTEDRELRSILEDASLGTIYAAVLEHRAVDGRERELQEHFGLGINQFPVELLETRAVTPAPTDVGQNQATIIPGIFPRSVAAFLGVSMPTVGCRRSCLPGADHERDWLTRASREQRGCGDDGRIQRRGTESVQDSGVVFLQLAKTGPDSAAWTPHSGRT